MISSRLEQMKCFSFLSLPTMNRNLFITKFNSQHCDFNLMIINKTSSLNYSCLIYSVYIPAISPKITFKAHSGPTVDPADCSKAGTKI